MLQAQVEKAQASYKDESLEAEESLIQIIPGQSAGRSMFSASGSGNSVAPRGKAAPKAKTKAAGANPLVAAAKARSKTMKDFCEADRNLKRAIEEGQKIFDEIAPTVLTEDQIRVDPSLDLLRSRLELARLASDTTAGREGTALSQQLYLLACQDPYLKDCRTTFLADEEACQTMGLAKHCRQTLLDLYHGCIGTSVASRLLSAIASRISSIVLIRSRQPTNIPII